MTLDPIQQFPSICRQCNVRRYGICGTLHAVELAHLNAATARKTIKKGEVITLDEDEVVRFANIVSGAVKLTKIMADGRQQIVGLQFAPEFVGRPFHKNSHLTIEAASDVELCYLPRNAVEGLIDSSPQFTQKLLDQTLVQLDEAREWMVTLGRKSASEKIASFLLLLDQHIGQDVEGRPGTRKLELPLTRNEIADFLGLTIETVSRQFTKFRKAAIIGVAQCNDVTIPSVTALTSHAGI